MGGALLTPRSRGPSDRLLDEAPVRLLLWLGLAFLFLPDLLQSGAQMAAGWDDHYFSMHEEVARQTLLEHGQLPVWNPWYCGGIPGIGNPQDASLAPDFLLRLLFGTTVGRRLSILLFFTLALEGMFRLARSCGASGLGALLAAVLFATSGRFVQFIEGGWLNFMTLALLPLLVLTTLRAQRDLRWAVAAGLLLGWVILAGGTYSTPYSVLVLGFVTADRTVAALWRPAPDGPRWWRPALVALLIGVVAACLSAVRLLPLLEVISEHPRQWSGEQSTPLPELIGGLFKAVPLGVSHMMTYIGPPAAALAVIALVQRPRLGRFAAVGALLFFALAAGDFGPASPYRLLLQLPVFGQLRSPHRLLVIVAFFLSLGAGLGLTGLQRLPQRLLDRRRRGTPPTGRSATLAWAGGLLLALGVATATAAAPIDANRLYVGRIYTSPHPLTARADFRQTLGNRWDAYHFALSDRGILACYEETAFAMSPALRADLPAEEYPLDPRVALVERRHWSPLRLVLRVEALVPTTVLVNQNHHERWRTNVGVVRSHEGLLAVDVPAGRHTLVLEHRLGLAAAGLPLSLATLLLGLALGLAALGRRLTARR